MGNGSSISTQETSRRKKKHGVTIFRLTKVVGRESQGSNPMERTIKYQRDVDPGWTHQVSERPGCESLLACMQCGTCSGACPLSIYMDLSPRRIMALVREGFRTEALKSQTIWLCASCYACGVHCPQKIKITDVMYSLKREAIASGLFPRHFPIPVLAREFYKMVKQRGRNAEFWLVLANGLAFPSSNATRHDELRLASMANRPTFHASGSDQTCY